MDSRASPEAARRARVRGRVQGVWFRASTAERATALGLRGRAENLPDGSVLVHVAGAAASVFVILYWLPGAPRGGGLFGVVVEGMLRGWLAGPLSFVLLSGGWATTPSFWGWGLTPRPYTW
jgi:acylphosphatase